MHVPQEAIPSRTLRNCAVCCAACRLVQLEDAGVDGAGGVKCGRAVQVQRGVRKHIGEEGVRIKDAYAELDACWGESNDIQTYQCASPGSVGARAWSISLVRRVPRENEFRHEDAPFRGVALCGPVPVPG